ncbi:MAG: response regulator receiver protein [uncultured bacterium]|nr:MAG: response regulator receiver protein [uncultured bacterium]
MQKRILIIEDEPDIATIVTYRLEATGYQSDTASNGKIALDFIQAQKYNLVFLDYQLPDMRAQDIALKIRASEMNHNIPIILATASIDDIAIKAKECLCVDFLTKPFEPETLLEMALKHSR